METKTITNTQFRMRIIISIVVFLLFIAGSVFAWKWLNRQPKEQGALKPLRAGLALNEQIFSTLHSNSHIAGKYSREDAVSRVRINGREGLKNDADTTNWMLTVIRNPGDTLKISLEELKALPKTEITFDFKCIEGWSQVTNWSGIRFSDFVARYGLHDQSQLNYTGMATPDGKYYVGLDNKSMMHPQTLLCYEMNGKPLPILHGYPLRLIIPVKYGVKHLKRIGTIKFSNVKPPDYWYERGYDYYCGL